MRIYPLCNYWAHLFAEERLMFLCSHTFCLSFPATWWAETLLIILFFFVSNVCTLETTTWRLPLPSIGGACVHVRARGTLLGGLRTEFSILGVGLSQRGDSLTVGALREAGWVEAGRGDQAGSAPPPACPHHCVSDGHVFGFFSYSDETKSFPVAHDSEFAPSIMHLFFIQCRCKLYHYFWFFFI